jgi:hypothetical protein
MNQGAREANDEARNYSERLHRERVELLLSEIRDLLRWHFRDDPMPSYRGAASPYRVGAKQEAE